jgi:tetratricopeptide (TPR) repeat protein
MPISTLPVSAFAARLLNLLLFCLAKAGVVRGGFWVWTLVCTLIWAPIGSLGVISGIAAYGQAAGGLQRVDADRVAAPGTTAYAARFGRHEDPAWLNIASHLPNPATATGDQLESAADVLRARKMPEDALEFYGYALQRGANQERVLNKLGVTELGLRDTVRARAYLKLVVKRDKKNAEAWNNLGATEYVDGKMRAATSDYRKAVKLNGSSAVFHANLAIALVEEKDFEGARKQFSIALDLDPELETKRDNSAGISARVLSGEDRARYCLEMAKVYATKGMTDAMLHSLAMAAENGMDLHAAMDADPILVGYGKDPRVVLLIQNAKAMKHDAMTAMAAPPALAAAPAH